MRHRSRISSIARSFLACAAALVFASPSIAFDEIDDALRDADIEFRGELGELAEKCKSAGQVDAAKMLSAWCVDRSHDRFVIFDVDDSAKAALADPDSWQAEFTAARAQRAATLFSIAHKAAKGKRRREAYALLWETLREDPQHAEARKMLGFERVEDTWALPFAAKQLQAGRVWHKQFGWLSKEDVPRYESGERRNGDRWVSKEQDIKRHELIRNGWRVETEYFTVTTNHSLEEGVRLATELERLQRAWRQVFVDYWMIDGEIEKLFAPLDKDKPAKSAFVPPPERKNRHRVTCYRDREEYVRTLERSQPRVAMSLGVYLDNGRTAYFFAGEDQHPATVLHEATHQLFKESKSTVKQPGARHGMWMIEAAACYMESLKRYDGYDTLGERDAGRFPAAAEKITEQFYVPLAELVTMSSDDLQRHREVAKVYSQAAGVMTYLLHADNGRYRLPAIVTLDAIYQGRAIPNTLSAACDVTFEKLDEDYIEFIKAAKR
jgi:hypothetical protein